MKSFAKHLLVFALFTGFCNYSLLATSSVNYSLAAPVEKNVTNNTALTSAKAKLIILTTNAWEYGDKVLIFNKQGVASVFKNQNTLSKVLKWTFVGADQYLELSSDDGQSIKTYELLLSEEGRLELSNIEDAADHIDAVDSAGNLAMLEAKRKILGTWKSNIYAKEVMEQLESKLQQSIVSASFQYELSSDGTFNKSIAINGETIKTYTGLWQVSKDATMLILHFGKQSFQSVAIPIKYYQTDELVLDQTGLMQQLLSLNGEEYTFFFNKQ